MRICITGTNGFVGKNLAKFLAQTSEVQEILTVYSNPKTNIIDNRKFTMLDSPSLELLSRVDVAILVGAFSTCHPYATYKECAHQNIIRTEF